MSRVGSQYEWMHCCPQLHIAQPSVPEAISVLRGLRPRYERHHGLRIADGALVAAVELSSRYLPDRYLPDKVRGGCGAGGRHMSRLQGHASRNKKQGDKAEQGAWTCGEGCVGTGQVPAGQGAWGAVREGCVG